MKVSYREYCNAVRLQRLFKENKKRVQRARQLPYTLRYDLLIAQRNLQEAYDRKFHNEDYINSLRKTVFNITRRCRISEILSKQRST